MVRSTSLFHRHKKRMESFSNETIKIDFIERKKIIHTITSSYISSNMLSQVHGKNEVPFNGSDALKRLISESRSARCFLAMATRLRREMSLTVVRFQKEVVSYNGMVTLNWADRYWYWKKNPMTTIRRNTKTRLMATNAMFFFVNWLPSISIWYFGMILC